MEKRDEVDKGLAEANPKGKDSKPRKKPRINKEEYKEILNYLIEKFPNCFFEESPKPLKIGIRLDLQAALRELGYAISSNRINGFMRNYCTKRAYILSHNEGEGRVDLAGNVVGYITKEQAENTKKLLPQLRKPGSKREKKIIHKNRG
ncbi:MAG: proQ [Rickettsiaceae bacterium]|jgi:ProP effector|nr:proQ [Rickettsiaceae bacterium]